MLSSIERRPITSRGHSRVRSGRYRKRYRSVLRAYDRYRSLVGTLDRPSIRHAVETTGLVSRDDPTLLELVCTFALLRALERAEWRLDPFRLFHGALQMNGRRGDARLQITYQKTPRALSSGSRYRAVQREHDLAIGALRPDLTLHYEMGTTRRWILIEVKGGERTVDRSARAALLDLLAYRSAFAPALRDQAGCFGIGIAWGAELNPTPRGEILLCTPDRIPEALAIAL